MALTLNTVTQFLHRALWLILYYQTNFRCKWTSSLEDMEVVAILWHTSPRCDLDIENSEPIFLHDTMPQGNTPPYKDWLQMGGQFRRHCLDKLKTQGVIKISPHLNFFCTRRNLFINNLHPKQKSLTWMGPGSSLNPERKKRKKHTSKLIPKLLFCERNRNPEILL